MEQEFSILQLIMNASVVVQVIIGILLLFSVISWAIIFAKWLTISQIKLRTHNFLRQFHQSNSISNLYTSLNNKGHQYSVESLFVNGINEYNKLNKQGITQKDAVLENIDRSLSASVEAQVDKLEHNLAMLATFGTVSPYIGLLGTVWGIMHAVIGLGAAGATGQATLSTVAPGIAEALVATAIGLFVAIPAYIAYNKFTSDINSLNNKMNKFGDEFLNLINRKIMAPSNNQDNM